MEQTTHLCMIHIIRALLSPFRAYDKLTLWKNVPTEEGQGMSRMVVDPATLTKRQDAWPTLDLCKDNG